MAEKIIMVVLKSFKSSMSGNVAKGLSKIKANEIKKYAKKLDAECTTIPILDMVPVLINDKTYLLKSGGSYLFVTLKNNKDAQKFSDYIRKKEAVCISQMKFTRLFGR